MKLRRSTSWNICKERFIVEFQQDGKHRKDALPGAVARGERYRGAAVAGAIKVQNIILWAVASVAVIVITFALLLVRAYRRLKHNHELLYRKNVEMQAKEDEIRRKRNEKYKGSSLAEDEKTG